MNLYERTVVQLDTLVVLLALERDEVFAILAEHEREWLPKADGTYLPGDLSEIVCFIMTE